MEHKTRTKALSLLLSLALALTLIPALGGTAQAGLDPDELGESIEITQNKSYVTGLNVTANVTMTISEGVTVTVNGGIDALGHTLTVAGKGTLIVTGAAGAAGGDGAEGEEGDFGSPGVEGFFGNNIIIDGPTVSITGGNGGNGGNGGGADGAGGNAGGYGGDGGNGVGGNVTVKSGVVTITGGAGGDGGAGGNGDSVGGNGGAGGIGGVGVGGDITVQGGVVSITGGKGGDGGNGGEGGEYGGDGGFAFEGGLGVGGNVTVSGGMLTLAGGAGGMGGAGGSNAMTPGAGENGKAVINGQIQGKIEESSDNSTWSPVTGTTSSARYVRVTSPHTHKFTYALNDDGDTITATCSADNCPLDDGTDAHNHTATLTLKPPANLIYDGKAKAATVENNINNDELTITYTKNNAEVNAADVKEIGYYAASVTLGGQTASVIFEIKDNTYTIIIPATLDVENAGWNATAGITAYGEIAEDKKLTVTATSANNWALKSGDNSVGYYLATAEGGEQTTAWEFTAEELAAENGTNKPMGAVVEEYINKPAGDYSDTVTFTAEVKSEGPKIYTSLTSGDVLHVGDVLDSTTTYNVNYRLITFDSIHTIIRADVEDGGEGWYVTEKEDGAYYVIKSIDRNNNNTITYSFNEEDFPVTATSDGILFTYNGTYWVPTVHEP